LASRDGKAVRSGSDDNGDNGALADADALARDAGRELRAAAGEAFFERHADLF